MIGARTYRVHFVGIGGIGMSGIAEVLLTLGYQVSGSDLAHNDNVSRLRRLGAVIHQGHAAEHLTEVDVVVVSSAVRPDNPEVLSARQRGIPVIPRAEMLAELMRMKRGIAVAGTHGKTTTTSLLGTVLFDAGLDPTLIIGGRLNSLGSNARLGQGEYLVAEADESDGSFLRLQPTHAIITNIDPEHLDHFGTFEAEQQAFLEFANRVPFYGLVVACQDHLTVANLLPRIGKRVVRYGFSPQAEYRAQAVEFMAQGTRFEAWHNDRLLGKVELRLLGRHNVQNSLAVIAMADEVGVPFDVTVRVLAAFQGVERRFSVLGEANGIRVVDDYAHHPEEIRATLAGARLSHPDRRILVVFQPHRFTRTRDLGPAFGAAFGDAHVVRLLEIYSAGEAPLPGVSGAGLLSHFEASGHPDADFLGTAEAGLRWLLENARPGDLVITMGAGDVWKLGRELVQRLGQSGRKD